jgi:hypothetical protein
MKDKQKPLINLLLQYINMKARDNKIPVELAPCGVFCGACPSFGKSCLGCASVDKNQIRKSKWACKIRNCCYFTKNKSFCFECGEFPCQELNRKLINSHTGDLRFRYRHEIVENLEKLSDLGIENYFKNQNEKWECPLCKGRIHWYSYRCSQCNQEIASDS